MWLTPSFIHPSVLVVQLQDGPVQFPLQLQFPHTHWPWSGPNKNNNTWVKRVGGSWKIKKYPNKASFSPESFLLNKESPDCKKQKPDCATRIPTSDLPLLRLNTLSSAKSVEQVKKERRKKLMRHVELREWGARNYFLCADQYQIQLILTSTDQISVSIWRTIHVATLTVFTVNDFTRARLKFKIHDQSAY